jgi:DNA-directed RNA polymerase subunit RPC12/RpoP
VHDNEESASGIPASLTSQDSGAIGGSNSESEKENVMIPMENMEGFLEFDEDWWFGMQEGAVRKKWNCQVCTKSFTKRKLLVVHEQSHGRGVKCETCGNIYKDSKYLRDHIKNGRCLAEAKPVQCKRCGMKSVSVDEALLHGLKAHYPKEEKKVRKTFLVHQD